jgi:hypothetical protein
MNANRCFSNLVPASNVFQWLQIRIERTDDEYAEATAPSILRKKCRNDRFKEHGGVAGVICPFP